MVMLSRAHIQASDVDSDSYHPKNDAMVGRINSGDTLHTPKSVLLAIPTQQTSPSAPSSPRASSPDSDPGKPLTPTANNNNMKKKKSKSRQFNSLPLSYDSPRKVKKSTEDVCTGCGALGIPILECKRCHLVSFCSTMCTPLVWKQHQKICCAAPILRNKVFPPIPDYPAFLNTMLECCDQLANPDELALRLLCLKSSITDHFDPKSSFSFPEASTLDQIKDTLRTMGQTISIDLLLNSQTLLALVLTESLVSPSALQEVENEQQEEGRLYSWARMTPSGTPVLEKPQSVAYYTSQFIMEVLMRLVSTKWQTLAIHRLSQLYCNRLVRTSCGASVISRVHLILRLGATRSSLLRCRVLWGLVESLSALPTEASDHTLIVNVLESMDGGQWRSQSTRAVLATLRTLVFPSLNGQLAYADPSVGKALLQSISDAFTREVFSEFMSKVATCCGESDWSFLPTMGDLLSTAPLPGRSVGCRE